MARRIGKASGRAMRGRVAAASGGASAALWPLVALAQEAEHAEAASRALGAPQDMGSIALITLGALIGLFAIAGLGFLYRRERRLDWSFQRPDAARDEHH